MKRVVVGFLVCMAGLCNGGEIPDLLISGYGSGATLIQGGEPVWNFRKGAMPCQDAWQLADGTFLVPKSDTVRILTRDNKELWKYQGETPASMTTPPTDPKRLKKWKPRKLEIHSCQPLPGGKVLITEGLYGRFIEVDSKGEIVKIVKPEGEKANNHMFNRVVRKTKQGTYVATLTHDRVGEFDANGKMLRMVTQQTTEGSGIKWGHVHGLAVLDNGNWLIGTGAGACFFEIDKNDKIVWKLTPQDLPQMKVTYAAGAHRLKDGTTVVSVFRNEHPVFAVSRDKKVLWKLPKGKKYINGITNVQVLNESGNPANFELQK